MAFQEKINLGIKRLRKKYDLTQEKFAEIVNMSIDSVSNLENNKYTPKARTIDCICQKFNIRPVDLLFDTPTDDIVSVKNLINDKLNAYSLKELLVINEMLDSLEKFYINQSLSPLEPEQN